MLVRMGLVQLQIADDRLRELIGEHRRHGVADHRELLFLRAGELVPVGERLQPRRFTDGQPTATTVFQPYAVHVARTAREIATGQRPRRFVEPQITRTAAMRRLFIRGNVAIHRGRQELGIVGNGS